MTHFVINLLLLVGVGASWLGAAALVKLKTPYDRLHLPGYVAIVSGACVTLAVFAAHPFSAQSLKIGFIYIALIGMSGILTHAIGRMLRIRGDKGRPS